jgi:hypothetical protein
VSLTGVVPLRKTCRFRRRGDPSIVFGSSCHLNLRAFCYSTTPARDTLDLARPALTILNLQQFIGSRSGTNSIISAPNRNDRVCRIQLWDILRSQLKRLWRSTGLSRFVLAPRPRNLQLDGIPFPVSILLLLTLSVLTFLLFLLPGDFTRGDSYLRLNATSLESWLNFSGPRFSIRGLSEYLEDLVVRINTPRLNELTVDKIASPNIGDKSCSMCVISNASLYLKPFHPGPIFTIRISQNPNG